MVQQVDILSLKNKDGHGDIDTECHRLCKIHYIYCVYDIYYIYTNILYTHCLYFIRFVDVRIWITDDVDFLAPFKYIELYRFIPQVCPPKSHNWLEHDSISLSELDMSSWEVLRQPSTFLLCQSLCTYWCLSPRVAVGISLICLASGFYWKATARHWEGTRTAIEWSMEGRSPCELSGSALERLQKTRTAILWMKKYRKNLPRCLRESTRIQ